MSRAFRLLAISPLLACASAAQSQPTAPSTTSDWTERLFSQIGGREAWARAKGFHMFEIMKSASYPQPVVREYWVDFEQPRIMEKALTGGLNRLQALNGNSGWRLSNGKLESWDPKTVAGWTSFWPGIPTRVFHKLARRDPSVEARALRPDRMDIYVKGRFAVWIATDPDGKPIAYGREENHRETHFLGRLRQYGPVRLWDSATEPGGLWQVEMIEYHLLDGPHSVSFEPPANGHTDPDPTS